LETDSFSTNFNPNRFWNRGFCYIIESKKGLNPKYEKFQIPIVI
jgi:hypothetical protein